MYSMCVLLNICSTHMPSAVKLLHDMGDQHALEAAASKLITTYLDSLAFFLAAGMSAILVTFI